MDGMTEPQLTLSSACCAGPGQVPSDLAIPG